MKEKTIKYKLLEMCSLAFDVGYRQKNKTLLTRDKVFERIWIYSMRNGYKDVMYYAYKAGLFAQEMKDLGS